MLFTFIKFFLPFVIWVILFRSFFFKDAVIGDDTFATYTYMKYFIDSLREGVYPLWNPFTLWGSPADVHLRQLGEFNPYVIFMLFFYRLGAGFYSVFLGTMVGYFFFGAIGFYLLSKEVLKDQGFAYLAFLFLLFSSVGFAVFNQINMILLYVPVVWFFYFLFRLSKTWEKRFCFGLTFCLTMILTTYLPFYFLTVFLLFAIPFCALFFTELKKVASGFIRFSRLQVRTIFLCAVAIGVALIPPVISYQSVQSTDMAIQTRHFVDATTFENGATMAYDEVKRGGLSDKMSIGDLFFNLKDVPFSNDGAVYLSLFFYLAILVTIFVRLNRKIMLLGLLALILFLISLTDASSVHRFLFEHVFYFQYFRNLYFFLPFLISVVILLACAQLKQFFQETFSQKARVMAAGFITAVHGVLFVFYFRQEEFPVSTGLTLFCSLGFFLAFVFGLIKEERKIQIIFLLSILVLIQPFEIMAAYGQNASKYRAPIIREALKQNYRPLAFSLSRPEYNSAHYQDDDLFNSYHQFNAYLLSREDSPGFIAYRYGFPTRGSYFFFQNFKEQDYRVYLQNKFWLYDRVMFQGTQDIEQFSRSLHDLENVAYVEDERLPAGSDEKMKDNDDRSRTQAVAIGGDSDILRVLSFNANALLLETNFDIPRFLVYTDSYHRNWRALVNGREVPLEQANIAFKGLWIPPGKARVDFRFMPWGGQGLYFFIQGLIGAFFVYTVFLFTQKLKKTA